MVGCLYPWSAWEKDPGLENLVSMTQCTMKVQPMWVEKREKGEDSVLKEEGKEL